MKGLFSGRRNSVDEPERARHMGNLDKVFSQEEEEDDAPSPWAAPREKGGLLSSGMDRAEI